MSLIIFIMPLMIKAVRESEWKMRYKYL
jgi:hypothetical protein